MIRRADGSYEPRLGSCIDRCKVDERVYCRAKNIYSNAEGVYVIGENVVGDQQLEQPPTKHERDNGDADSSDGGEHPNEEDEEGYPSSEMRRNVDKLVLIGRVQIGVGDPSSSSSFGCSPPSLGSASPLSHLCLVGGCSNC